MAFENLDILEALAAIFGFAGAMVILNGAWSTLPTRKAAGRVDEPAGRGDGLGELARGVRQALSEKSQSQLVMERNRYLFGSGLLGLGFLFQLCGALTAN